jgi:hypothetical protein
VMANAFIVCWPMIINGYLKSPTKITPISAVI